LDATADVNSSAANILYIVKDARALKKKYEGYLSDYDHAKANGYGHGHGEDESIGLTQWIVLTAKILGTNMGRLLVLFISLMFEMGWSKILRNNGSQIGKFLNAYGYFTPTIFNEFVGRSNSAYTLFGEKCIMF
jgi:hypothetical protein